MPQKLVNSMFEEQKAARQTIHLRGRESSPHYVFLHSDEESSADEDGISLHAIKRPASLRKIQVINVQVKAEDTLQALALRYRCTISELKRINKIDKENEIYAKPYIKVPVQPFSILTEASPESHGDNATSEQRQGEAPAVVEEQLIDLGASSTSTESSNAEINAIILNSVCEPLSTYNSANIPETPHSEHDALLDGTENAEAAESCETDMFKCSGDNWGLSWTQLLVFSLLLSFAGPIIYILYIAEYSIKADNITVSN
ncbi:PREDICTED: lysM and putative peptidoglycan-binding domain-containing protein 4 isoform X1 [Vollenhovia emeryi]|uniref:lysM and putative peptidoglycan-binding domain-containing protein 4 isoform X1 n=1 Tax=Vollenhovia emeryi TaxID=411798 RepID=UPI0005F3670F|nr:PREDICTED: lysM and putative peptidoglycan-binding domain-containing protein 4 isoform X1 [Vollenhovia emeryi]